MSDFTDRQRSTLTFITLGEHNKMMAERKAKVDPLGYEDYRTWRHMEALSTRIKMCRINRSKGQGKFTRISDKTLIYWERRAEKLQRDNYELQKHLNNAQRLSQQGYRWDGNKWVKVSDGPG